MSMASHARHRHRSQPSRQHARATQLPTALDLDNDLEPTGYVLGEVFSPVTGESYKLHMRHRLDDPTQRLKTPSTCTLPDKPPPGPCWPPSDPGLYYHILVNSLSALIGVLISVLVCALGDAFLSRHGYPYGHRGWISISLINPSPSRAVTRRTGSLAWSDCLVQMRLPLLRSRSRHRPPLVYTTSLDVFSRCLARARAGPTTL